MKRQLDSKLRAYQITSSQWAVLKFLSQNDKLSQVEIAQAIKTDKATCGAIIDKLIKKEFVKRTISQQDQRARIIEISPLALSVTDELTSLDEETNTEAKGTGNIYKNARTVNYQFGKQGNLGGLSCG